MREFKTFSPEETENLGYRLGEILQSSDVVCLKGDLGTGKTAFTHGIARALGVEGYITSPTFTIVNEYDARVPFYHFDVYRVADPEEMFEIGFEEYIDGKGIVVIEWAELIKDILPQDCIWASLDKDMDNPDVRLIRLEFNGQRYKGYEKQLTEDS